jgi:serine/threonine protein phosphatase 1
MRYAIADIHGCYQTFRSMVEDHLHLTHSDTLYLLGDYTDRGPATAELLNYIMNLQKQGYTLVLLRGNHDQMLLDAYNHTSENAVDLWLYNGGQTTLESYGVKSSEEMPAEHIKLIESTRYFVELDDYWLVHAGFNFQNKDWQSDNYAMLWDREEAWDGKKLNQKPVIHGHTPTPVQFVKEYLSLGESVVSIDTGCVYTHYTGMGYLSCLCLDNRTLVSIANIDTREREKS